ncbi:MAG: lipopolysaccharide heptosyltransferase II [Desulfobacterota bacterium]|nr:lipopolysaccharide heptosyltransferase II [Thermodesulfobacteriota bacterium]MDW8001149.1 lipopolysaccharide heptosyltransferase II [Deltaproteobacteria bacterium]
MIGRTIVYLPNWLGDMVMAIPFLYSLRRHRNDEIWYCGNIKAVHLYNGLDLFDRFFALHGKGVTDLLKAAADLREKSFSTGIILPHSFRSALLFFLARIKERIGYEKNGRGFLLTKRIKPKKRVEPTIEHYLKIADVLQIEKVLKNPILVVTQDEERSFFERHGELKIPYAVFTVGAKYGPSKCWPEEYYAALIDMLAISKTLWIYILPDFGEEEKVSRIIKKVKKPERVEVKYFNVRDLKVCISGASFLLTNDTGPRHIGSALGIPTIVLLGPMDETYTTYFSPHTFVMKSPVPCSPCNKRICDKEHECMRGIKPEDVFEKIEEILSNERSA